MISAPHDLPCIAVVVDVASPGQRLETDAQAVRSRELTQGVEIRCRAIDSADRGRRNIAADQQQIRLQFLHQVEFVLCAGKVARALRLGHALEIAKRLKRADGKTEIPAELANVARAPIERE